MNKALWKALVCGVAIGTLDQTGAALAQSAGPPSTGPQPAPAAPEASPGTDIIVTAQKRSERLQDVPLSITAYTSESIERQGIKTFEDYAARSAGVHLSRDGTQSSFSIRGIQSTSTADTTSATAGIYVDDYPLYDTWFRFSSPDVRVFDVERIEVLRGPQGTLYGATSLSGSIRIITAKPNLTSIGAKFEGTLSTTDGTGRPNYDVDAMVNVPLSTDKVAIRAVGYARRDSGYVDNPVRGQTNVDDRRTYGGRFYLRAAPTESLDLLASFTYQRDEQDDQTATYYFPTATRTINQFNAGAPNITRSDLLIASISANQELGNGNLTLTGTYGENKSRNSLNATPFAAIFGAAVPTSLIQPSNSNTKIVEARYTSDATKPLRFVLGAYYNSRFREFQQNAYQPALIPIFGTSRIYQVSANQRASEYAAFGEGTWAFAPRFEFTAGLRVFRNTYHFTSDVSGLLNNPAAPLVSNLTDTNNNQTSTTPRFSLSYKPVRNVNIYATASKGYRFGLTNFNAASSTGIPLAYKSDSLWNYELGLKATMWDGRVTLNTSGYYVAWSDIQLTFINPNGQGYITNAGDARSYGLESELSFRPTHAFELNASLSVGRAELSKDNPGIQRRAASARGPKIVGVFAGDRLPGSQEVSASGGVQYTIENVGSGDAYIRLDDVYVGPSYTDFMKAGSLQIGDYNLVNLRLGYKLDKFEIVGFADNLFNSRGIVNAVPNADVIGLTDAAYRVRPRTIGLTLRARY
uniref:TonB-dependent receptor n=1 Tax=uncultured Sphingomonas sp. TaxID=158754 RepID=UPI0035CB7E59